MQQEVSFVFIDVSKQKEDPIVGFEIRAQAAIYGYTRRLQAVNEPKSQQAKPLLLAETCTTLQTRANAVSNKVRKRTQRKKRFEGLLLDTASVSVPPSRPLASYTQPPVLKNQIWVNEALQTWLNDCFPQAWAQMDLESQLGVSTDMIVNW